MLIQRMPSRKKMFKKGWLAIPSVAVALFIGLWLSYTGRAFSHGWIALTITCFAWLVFVTAVNIPKARR